MYATGRTTYERYFSFQQPMNASAIARDDSAYISTASSAERCRREIIWLTTLIQWNPGVPVATGLSAQKSAICRFSGVSAAMVSANSLPIFQKSAPAVSEYAGGAGGAHSSP